MTIFVAGSGCRLQAKCASVLTGVKAGMRALTVGEHADGALDGTERLAVGFASLSTGQTDAGIDDVAGAYEAFWTATDGGELPFAQIL